MPELPEVENIRLQLEKYLIGHEIQKVEVRYKKCFTGESKKIVGAKIKSVRRFGKALVIDLNNGLSVLMHVKMTGQPIYRGSNLKQPPKLSEKVLGGLGGKHTQIIFHLDQGGKLYYNDVRKFGWIKIADSSKLETESKFLEKLGPEVVIDKHNPPQNPLTLEKFEEILSKSKKAIKTLLMDQSKIAGVGNIYANDALWFAKIKPQRNADSLKPKETEELFKAIKSVLKEGLKRGGASENAFVTPDGKEGEYQEHFLVYGREGEKCKRCKGVVVEKIKIGGRGTYYCPKCQR